jgi:phage-related tail fiber protein
VAVRKPLVLVAGAVSELPAADTIAGGGSATIPQDFKDSVDCATTGNVTLSGEQTIDGVVTAASRVLVWQQTTGPQNGLYLTTAGAWSRTTDADASAEVTSGMQVYVEGGTANGGQTFVLTTPDPITLGTTTLTFTAAPIAPATFVGKTVTGTAYTHAASDSGKRLNLTNAAAKTVTVAPNASVASPVNTEIEVFNAGAGIATIAPGSGVTINAAGSTLRQFQGGKLKKRANPNTWDFTPYGYPAPKHTLGASWSGAGVAVTTSTDIVYVNAHTTGTITKVVVLTQGGSGSCVIDIWKDTYGNFPPTVADTITASAKPTIASNVKYSATALTGWATAVTAGDIFAFKIDSTNTFTAINIFLEITP